MLNKSELKEIYDANYKFYEKVCINAQKIIEKALRAKKINLLQINFRVKSFESFYEKLSRKNYQDPFVNAEDLCGVRVVCFYIRELPIIDEIIKDNFLINDYIDKSEKQDVDRFGYRSNHHIVYLPNQEKFSKLKHFKIEFQSRTLLMHAWAHLQGNLEYKRPEHTPKAFKRKLNRLSAVLEMVDEQFQSLKIEKNDLRELLLTDYNFSNQTELNIDTFISYLDVCFPDRKTNYRSSKLLLKKLLNLEVNFEQIIASYKKVKSHLIEFEEECDLVFTQEEALIIVLCIHDINIFNSFIDDPLINAHQTIIKKWFKKLKN